MSYRTLPSPLTIRRSQVHDGARLEVAGELDLFSATTLGAELERLVAAGERLVVVDLEQVRLLDSSALATLLAAQQDISGRGGVLRLVNLTASARRVIEITGLEHTFGLDESASRSQPMVATG